MVPYPREAPFDEEVDFPLDDKVYEAAMQLLSNAAIAAIEAESTLASGPAITPPLIEGLQAETTPELEEVLQMSEEAALCQEQAHLQEALLRSKSCGGPPISGDDIVIFRLSRFSKDVQEILSTSSQLGPCHHQVTDAGCQVRPDFTDATCLVPITAEQYAELDLHLEVTTSWLVGRTVI